MTITSLRPGDSLAAATDQTETLARRLRAAEAVTGTETWAHIRASIRAASTAEVDAIAGQWGSEPGWNRAGTEYYASVRDGDAVLCMAVYTRQDREDKGAHPERPAAA